MVDSEEFATSVKNRLAATSFMYPTPEDLKAAYEDMTQKEWLDSEQLLCILEAANTLLGTNFQLGLIVKGHRYRWDSKRSQWDYKYVLKTSAQISGQQENKPTLVSADLISLNGR